MQKSLIINSTGNASLNIGKKYQKAVGNINPNVSNEKAGTFAQMANALTTNVLSGAQIVKKMSVTEEDTVAVTLSVDDTNYTGGDCTSATIDGGIRLTLGDKGYVDVTY